MVAGLIINRFSGDGLEVTGFNNSIITCNLIGTTSAGTAAAANGGNGLRVNNSGNVQIGGTTGDTRNIIAFNTGRGITVEGTSSAVNIHRNSLHSNGDLGLDLAANGVTLNDPSDVDTGPNALQNFPLLTSIVSGDGGATSTITGSLSSTASTTPLFLTTVVTRLAKGKPLLVHKMSPPMVQVMPPLLGDSSFVGALSPPAPFPPATL